MAIEIGEFDNPPNAGDYIIDIILAFILLAFSFILYAVFETPTYKPYFIFWLISGISLLLFLNPFYKHNYRRPTRIRIEEHGIILLYKSGKQRVMPWNIMQLMIIATGSNIEKSTINGRAGLHITNDTFVVDMTYEIACKTLDAYLVRTGTRLPTRISKY